MPTNTTNPLNFFDPHMLVIAATRYFIGRMTIATGSHCRELIMAWPHLPDQTKAIIQRDINEAFDSGRSMGMQIDRVNWERVRELWKKPDAKPA